MVDTSITSTPSKTRRVDVRKSGDRAVLAGESLGRTATELRFGAVRAIQAGRAYFVTACPLGQVSEILSFDSADLPPELRAQRVLNKGRVPQIARYLSANPSSYVLSAITASVDADMRFEAAGAMGGGVRCGELVVPAGARILVNDGQHRRAAIMEALKSTPQLAHESIPLVLFLDAGLARSQQIFADLNRRRRIPSSTRSNTHSGT